MRPLGAEQAFAEINIQALECAPTLTPDENALHVARIDLTAQHDGHNDHDDVFGLFTGGGLRGLALSAFRRAKRRQTALRGGPQFGWD